MFPEISRDDVFRLETRSLWLRWPQVADIRALAADAGARASTPEAASGDPYRDPGVLDAWREDNATGGALHLLLTGRDADRRVIGAVDLEPVRGRAEACGLRLRVWLDAEVRGQGLGTEAVQAMVDAAFMLTGTPLVAASARVLDPGFRRVLEKSGFGYCGTGLDPAGDDCGLTASDRFRLDHKAWASLKRWRVPGLVRSRAPSPAVDMVQ
ncbi:MAG: GNAT family N-acetyltransferase [Janthinobacterium lividum]